MASLPVQTMSVATTTDVVLPDSIWTYIGFQIPASQVDELRILLHGPNQYRYGEWRRTDSSETWVNTTLQRDDESCRIWISKRGSSVSWKHVDKDVQFCLETGLVLSIISYSLTRRRYFGIRAVLTRAMQHFHTRKQRRDAASLALDELRLLIPDFVPACCLVCR